MISERPSSGTVLRWLVDLAADGPTNMARDEAILLQVGEGRAPPTLRFYRWNPATISLGYFQKYEEYESLPSPAGDLAVVRRQTGGGAILHDLELTYSLILPLQHPMVTGGKLTALYDRVHQSFADLLRSAGVSVVVGPRGSGTCSHGGPFFCFERHSCNDLICDGKKLMGSAQRRTPFAVLQHGSLILDLRYDQQICATVADHVKIDVDAQLPKLAETITGSKTERADTLTSEELEWAGRLRDKYRDPAWIRRR